MKSLPLAMLPLAFAAASLRAQSDSRPVANTNEPSAESDESNTPDIVVEGELPKEQRRVCSMETSTGSTGLSRVGSAPAAASAERAAARSTSAGSCCGLTTSWL